MRRSSSSGGPGSNPGPGLYAAAPGPRGRGAFPPPPARRGRQPEPLAGPAPRPVPPRPVRYRYFALWKPYGVPARFESPEGGPTLRKYVPLPDLHPVGRLDSEGEGLLLLTDDPRFHAALTRPGSLEGRVWLAQVEHQLGDQALESLRSGIVLGDRRTLPAEVRPIPEPDLPVRPVPIRYRKSIETSWMELVVFEGWARQVRRLTAAVGHPTLRLVQWAVGPVTLKGMTPGQLREFSFEELRWAERVAAEAPERRTRRPVSRPVRGPRREGPGSEHGRGPRREGSGSEHGRGPRREGPGSEHGRGPRREGSGGEHGRGPRREGPGSERGRGPGREGPGSGRRPTRGRPGPGGPHPGRGRRKRR